MNTGRKRKCWEKNLSHCNVICPNYHRLPWVGSQVRSSAGGRANQSASIEACQNGIFKAGMGVIMKLLNMVRPKCCEGKDS
jgi:hypothetical protein